jgi:branched-chain amino acid transport system ATP-binding protein
MPDKTILTIRDLQKSFGALTATDHVDLAVRSTEIHALIGPNGAGKSTLIAQICGEVTPDAGNIVFDGADITDLPPHTRARMGLARSFQVTQLCPEFSVIENMLLAVQAGRGAFNLLSNPRHDVALLDLAVHWIDVVGLGDRQQVAVENLAHGERRQLEIAMALCREPKLLLLDEPMAGMGAEESLRMTRLLQQLKGQYGMLLVEHDMDAVFSLADRVSVLVYGRVIFTGSARDARNDPQVRAAYLGQDHAAD